MPGISDRMKWAAWRGSIVKIQQSTSQLSALWRVEVRFSNGVYNYCYNTYIMSTTGLYNYRYNNDEYYSYN